MKIEAFVYSEDGKEIGVIGIMLRLNMMRGMGLI